ncbi:MAG: catabolite repression HPr-like protein [Epulopiscium sp.]|jgi:catabolite repression HPr-like protein/phosphocarrier protein|uniref:HPr family phosphocarrier protein n=1 Tax=Defluviitalea raffinosedens TaxID=1450156 RepID=A0A7C8LHM2_9FIRM|nr:HPr family phosphocarrier protein [Defluviitalea raffinosedens]KAE9635484.1 HPr family phosphocarrier protein [Defluviitalea raffinosedens]MBM7684393.1 catabolite repression HPr-like protein/phosphocarrier protein [Defluviitalea raffinosedens]MDK2787339.1 catabolite repression HPr-like protein [Candidatus Epulonipiscium sp.]HHW68501.1 HPr family phosphocarrier protein [Candidatus Epulonipiscium sp.]
MIEKTVRVQIESGLEARPAALFVQIASQYESQIYVMMEDKQVNAKSIMGMMSLGALEGQEVIIHAEGKDENEAVEKLVEFLTSHKE